MELLQIKYFFDSARSESFAKTAEKYMVPASSVSSAVKRLENELGCKLFDRSCNKITLNEKGRKLQRSLAKVFDELDKVGAELARNGIQDVKIKLLVKSLRASMVEVVAKYRETHPNVRFEMIFDANERCIDSCDLIIDEKSEKYVGYKKFEICSRKVLIKASADSSLCQRTLVMKDLEYQNFVTMGKETNLHKLLLKACKNAGFLPNIVVETNDIACYTRCIERGVGLGIGRSVSKNAVALSVIDFDERQVFYGYYNENARDDILEFVDFMRRWSVEN